MLRTVLIVGGVAVVGYLLFSALTGSSPAAVARTIVNAPPVPPREREVQRAANSGAGHF